MDEKNGRQQEKQTKAQAFYDPLAKQQLAEVMEDSCRIDHGYLQSAKNWGRNRETVSKFINRLVAEKAARTFSHARKVIVNLTNVAGPKRSRMTLCEKNGVDRPQIVRHYITYPQDRQCKPDPF